MFFCNCFFPSGMNEISSFSVCGFGLISFKGNTQLPLLLWNTNGRRGQISQGNAAEERRGGRGTQPQLCSLAPGSRENWRFPRVCACVFVCFQLMLCLSGIYLSRWSLEVFKLYFFGTWLPPITHVSVAARWNFSLLISLPFILFPVCSKPLFLVFSLSLLVVSCLHPSIPPPSAPSLLMQSSPSPGVSAPTPSRCQQEWQSSLTLGSIHNA